MDKEQYLELLAEHRQLKLKYKKLLERKQKRVEFSKIILGAVMVTYFIGLFFAIYAVNKILMEYPDSAVQALISLFGYIGAPISIAIGFYSWKAKHENTIKIQCANEECDGGN